MIENELLRYLAYIHNYLEQERNEIHQPINEINETPSVNNPKSPDLIRKNIFERGINKFLQRKKK